VTFCHVCVAKVGDGVFDLQLSLFGRLPLGALGHRTSKCQFRAGEPVESVESVLP
jgi:hypothetical protein